MDEEKITHILLERMNRMEKTLREDTSSVKEDIETLKKDVGILKESVQRIDARMSSMDHYMAGFYTEQRWHNDETDDIKRRLFKLEKTDNPEHPQD